MKKIGLFYAPKGGSTEEVAKKVAQALNPENVELILVGKETPASKISEYDFVIFGISTVGKDTWETNYAKSGWDWYIDELDKAELKGKKIALFGLGNCVTYPDHFVNALGVLGKKLIKLGAEIIGQCNTEGYEFEESSAIVDGKFLGLPLDEDTQSELTDERVEKWTAELKKLI